MTNNKGLMLILFSLLVLPLINASWNNSLNNGLEYYYTFNESSGIDVKELITNLNGEVTGNSNFISGIIGNSFYFDGATYINLSRSNEPSLNQNTNRTFSFWYKSNYTSNTMVLLSSHNSNSGIYMNLGINKIGFFSSSVGDYEVATESLPLNASDGNFHHITIIRASGLNNKIYFDGVSMSLSANNLLQDNDAGTIILGKRPDGLYFRGYIDEFALWNRTITEEEDEQLFNNGLGITYELNESLIIPDVYVNLNNPTSNQYLNSSQSVTFNCSIYDTEILNLTLVINGTDNITVFNTTSNQSSLSLEQTYTLENGVYLWGCYGFSVGNTNNSYDSFEMNYTIPIIPPIEPSTTDTTIRDILTSSGAGIGIFIIFIARSLPILLLGIAMAGIVFIIGMAFVKIFKGLDFHTVEGVVFK